MLHKLCDRISLFLVSHGLSKKNQAVYTYGAECLLGQLLYILPLLIWSCFLHCVPEAIVWILSFTALRSHIGGYHAKKQWKCTLCSILLGIVSVYFCTLWIMKPFASVISSILLILCLLLIIWKAPISHPAHPLTVSKQRRERFLGICTLIVEMCTCAIFYFCAPSCYGAIINGIIAAVILFVIILLLSIPTHKPV